MMPKPKPSNKVNPNAYNTCEVGSAVTAIYSKTNTASKAPIGSITIPSQRKILAKLDLGCTVRNMGTITVGPVTTTNAPNSIAIDQSKPKI